MPRANGRGRCWCWAAVSRAICTCPRTLQRHRHGADRPRRRRAARVVPAQPGVGPRSGVHRVQRGRRRAGRQADHQLPVGGVGLRDRLGGRPGPPGHRVLPDAAAPRVRAAGHPGRRGRRRHPHRAVARPADRTGSSRRYGSTASPWCPTPGPCCATSSTIPAFVLHGNHPVRLFIGSGMPTGLWQRVVDAFAPAHVVEFFATTDGQAVLANVSGVKIGSKGRPLPGAGRVELGAYDAEHDLILEDERGFVQLAEVNQVGVLLAAVQRADRSDRVGQTRGLRARRHLDIDRVPVPPRRGRGLLVGGQARLGGPHRARAGLFRAGHRRARPDQRRRPRGDLQRAVRQPGGGGVGGDVAAGRHHHGGGSDRSRRGHARSGWGPTSCAWCRR